MRTSGAFRLPDLAYEGEAWAVVRVTIPKSQAGDGNGTSLTNVMSVSATFTDLEGEVHEVELEELKLPSLTAAAWNAVIEDELVARRASELESAKLQDEAQVAARRGDWREVRRLLAEARRNAEDNEWLTKVADKLEVLARKEDEMMFSKETRYSSHRMRSRLAMSSEVNSLSDAAPSYLRRKTEQGKSQRKR
jgi:Ca-activated chloride channel family protein